MRPDHDSSQLRRYVLGALTEDKRARIEHEYLERAEVLDRVCAAEDDLIDDYLRIVSPPKTTSDSSGNTWLHRVTARASPLRARSGLRHQHQDRLRVNVSSTS